MSEKKIDAIKEAVHLSSSFEETERSLILEKIEEWRHEDEAMSFLPGKLMELSKKVGPILEEMGLL